MAWYYGTYNCGHKGKVNITGPSKDRLMKSEWHFSGVCPDCYKKQMEAEKEQKHFEATKKSMEMELPELSGTEKQVAWAITLRLKLIELLHERFEMIDKKLKDKGIDIIPGSDAKMSDVADALEYFVQAHTDSKFWIESRDRKITLKDVLNDYKKHVEEEAYRNVREETDKEEELLTYRPESDSKKPGIAKIILKENILITEYIKDEDFIDIVKSLGYKWNGTVWNKKITEFTGSADDRSAELGNKLLSSGFTVRFSNMESKDMAIAGTYSPEGDRWVKYHVNAKQLAITWKKRSDTLYDVAKKLPGARWKDGSMRVNVEFYREVEDFADTMGFSISQKAKKKIEEYKRKEAEFERADVNIPKEEKISDEERIKKTLKSDGTILEDLKDDA